MSELTEIHAGLTYKLIDKEGYINANTENKNIYDEIFKGKELQIVTLSDVTISDGWSKGEIVIVKSEYKYFEEYIPEGTQEEEEPEDSESDKEQSESPQLNVVSMKEFSGKKEKDPTDSLPLGTFPIETEEDLDNFMQSLNENFGPPIPEELINGRSKFEDLYGDSVIYLVEYYLMNRVIQSSSDTETWIDVSYNDGLRFRNELYYRVKPTRS